MALPKRRHSNTRTRTRRAHDHLSEPRPGVCPRCRQPKRAHTVCAQCGFYRVGKKRQEVAVIPMSEDSAS